MPQVPNVPRLKRLVPRVATVLTLSLAVTLRIERACSDQANPVAHVTSVLYPFSELMPTSRDLSPITRRVSHLWAVLRQAR
jgi:hypothetical protein